MSICAAEAGLLSSAFDAFLIILVYDMVAFCFQLPIGALLDNIGGNARTAMLSCVLVGLGVMLAGAVPLEAAALIVGFVAIGNAVFHCAGGIDVLGVAGGRASLPGVFIATGAFGVFFAPVLVSVAGVELSVAVLVFLLTLSACALACLFKQEQSGRQGVKPAFELPPLSRLAVAAFALVFLTVLLRSYTGFCMAFPWKGELVYGIVAVCSVVAGKAFGGFIADRFGFLRTSVFSLGSAAALFLFSWTVPACGVVASFLFNFTMPITLTAMADMFPNAKGTAFGAASFALAIGGLPALLGFTLADPVMLCVLSVLSLGTLAAGLTLKERVAYCDANIVESNSDESR